MTMTMTGELKQAFDQERGRLSITHPDTGVEYALVPVADLRTLIEDAADQREQKAFAEFATQQLIARLEADEA